VVRIFVVSVPLGRLGHAHRLQPPLAARDLRQVVLLLRLAAVAQQGAHVVHLAVAGAGVAAAAVDLSMTTLASARPRPEPPYSCGISAASQPAFVSASTKASG
jgi:hypothetical protein